METEKNNEVDVSGSIIIKNTGSFNPEDGTNIVEFEYEGHCISLRVPTSVAINEDESILKGWSLTFFQQYLKYGDGDGRL